MRFLGGRASTRQEIRQAHLRRIAAGSSHEPVVAGSDQGEVEYAITRTPHIAKRSSEVVMSSRCQADGVGVVEEVVDAADEVAFEVDFGEAPAENRPGQTARTVISRRVDVSASLLSPRRRLPL